MHSNKLKTVKYLKLHETVVLVPSTKKFKQEIPGVDVRRISSFMLLYNYVIIK